MRKNNTLLLPCIVGVMLGQAATNMIDLRVANATEFNRLMLAQAGADTTDPATADSREFKNQMKSGADWEKAGRAPTALLYYRNALGKAQTNAQRAEAQLGIARNTPATVQGQDPQKSGETKNQEFLKVIAIPQAPADLKADATFGMAQVQAELGRYESAYTLLTQVLQMPDIRPEQKRKAALWIGQVLGELKRYAEVRATLSELLKAEDISMDEKILAHRHLARAYLAEGNVPAAKNELSKTVAFAGLKDERIADIHIANGDFLSGKDFTAPARDEYSKVAILADVTPDKNVQAKLHAGESYFKEKNYVAAREAWNQALNMRGSQKSTAIIWRAIGQAHEAEKNYPAAREAYEKVLATPTIELREKVETWQRIANTHVQQKNYATAREVLGNIGQGALAGSTLHLQMHFDLASVYREEGDFTNAVKTYDGILQTISEYQQKHGRKTTDQYRAQDMIEEAAAELAGEPASMAAAYTLWEALEKHHPYDKEKAEANLGMGDILLAQGKRDEAKTKYEKALQLRKTYNEGKLAQEKLNRLAAP